MKILFFSLLFNAVLAASALYTEKYSLRGTEILVQYDQSANQAYLNLSRATLPADRREIKLIWRSHARLRRLSYLNEKFLILVELAGRNTTFFALPIEYAGGQPIRFGPTHSKTWQLSGDRGDVDFISDYLFLVLGYPGSLNLLKLPELELVGSKAVSDWPQRVVTCEDRAYVAPLWFSARPTQLAALTFSNVEGLIQLFRSPASLPWAKIVLDDGFVVSSMEPLSDKIIRVNAARPRAVSKIYDFECSRKVPAFP